MEILPQNQSAVFPATSDSWETVLWEGIRHAIRGWFGLSGHLGGITKGASFRFRGGSVTRVSIRPNFVAEEEVHFFAQLVFFFQNGETFGKGAPFRLFFFSKIHFISHDRR
jgi:hypothetical protein